LAGVFVWVEVEFALGLSGGTDVPGFALVNVPGNAVLRAKADNWRKSGLTSLPHLDRPFA
jgi:hypothetical protein